MDCLLEIRNLTTVIQTEKGDLPAVNGLNLKIKRKGIQALVGESGCGKSMTALSILGLIPSPPAKITSGNIIFNSAHIEKSQDLLALSEEEMRSIRGHRIAMIFQEPMTSLNPVFTVGDQIQEVIILHQKVSQKEARDRSIEMLRKVGIPSPDKRIDDYPHQMSGGMRQRVMIAMALACNPELLIADEPTTALDVTIQAQILELMQELINEMGMSMLLITHDLGVVAEYADDIAVMYAGQIVESADVKSLFKNPSHPYTRGLIGSIPSLKKSDQKKLNAIPGSVPALHELPVGCTFLGRCEKRQDDCEAKRPHLTGEEHKVRCYHPYGGES